MKKYKTKVVNFGDLKVGDRIIGSDGKPTTITNVYEKHLPEKMYEIEMDDGQVIRASGNHLWYCETDIDIEWKDDYFMLAKHYFENNEIPKKDSYNPHYPLAIITTKFGDSIKTRLFIEKACRSLGYSLSTPHIVFKDDGSCPTEEQLYRYSFNDLITFLHEMKEAITNNSKYFYFGEVRTTEEIFKLKWYNINVNIPNKGEIK